MEYTEHHREDVHRLSRICQILVLCMALVFVVLGTYARSFGDTANSRLATVLSLTQHGTFYLDRPLDEEPNRFEQGTIDKVMAKGHILSSKPPMMPIYMTAQYLAIHTLLGLDLTQPEDTPQIIRLMTMTLVGLSYMLILIFFARMLELFVADPMTRLLLLFALAFCTQIWGYSTNINNHVPGTCLTVMAVYWALGLASGKLAPTPWRFLAFGLTGGLVPTVDTPAAIFVFVAGLFVLKAHPRQTLVWTALGAALPLAVHGLIMWNLTGSPLPVQTRDELYKYRGAYWRHPIEVDALNEPKLNYLFHITLGRVGLFSLYPITMIGIVGAIRAIFRRDTPHRVAILAGFAAFMVLTAYYVVKTNNYGGQAYGFRWFIPAMPVLLWMGAPVIASLRTRWQWIFIGLMLGVSFYSAWECTVTPWQANQEWTIRFLGPSYR